MNAKKSLRAGIIGCGHIAQESHIPCLNKIKGVNVVAICDRDEDLANRISKRFNIGRYYTDFSEMINRESLDFVDICTSPASHADLSVQAATAGCHVLVEKPMAMNLNEADTMVEAAREHKINLCVVHSMLFEPVVAKAISLEKEGVLGKLTGIDMRFAWTENSEGVIDKDHWYHKLPGGAFGEMLPHTVYLARSFLDDVEPIVVRTKKLSNSDWLPADELRVILESKRGIVTINVSLNWPTDTIMLDIFGTKMNLHVDLMNSALIKYSNIQRENFAHALLSNLSEGSQYISCAISRALSVILGINHIGHHNLIRAFVESVQNGTRSPVTAEEAREAMSVFEQVASQIDNELRSV